MSNWEHYKLQIWHHYAPIWYNGKPAFFIKLQDDDQQIAMINLDNKVIAGDRETLTPRATKKAMKQGSPYDAIVAGYARQQAYNDFVDSTVDDGEYNAYLEHKVTRKAEYY